MADFDCWWYCPMNDFDWSRSIEIDRNSQKCSLSEIYQSKSYKNDQKGNSCISEVVHNKTTTNKNNSISQHAFEYWSWHLTYIQHHLEMVKSWILISLSRFTSSCQARCAFPILGNKMYKMYVRVKHFGFSWRFKYLARKIKKISSFSTRPANTNIISNPSRKITTKNGQMPIVGVDDSSVCRLCHRRRWHRISRRSE